jgi:hypothetical protein
MRCSEICGKQLQEETEFSQGERGRFYRVDANLNIPV